MGEGQGTGKAELGEDRWTSSNSGRILPALVREWRSEFFQKSASPLICHLPVPGRSWNLEAGGEPGIHTDQSKKPTTYKKKRTRPPWESPKKPLP